MNKTYIKAGKRTYSLGPLHKHVEFKQLSPTIKSQLLVHVWLKVRLVVVVVVTIGAAVVATLALEIGLLGIGFLVHKAGILQ